MFYDLTIMLNDNKIECGSMSYEKNWFEEIIKLLELFYVIVKNYSVNNIEDAYLIYRNCGALLKKIVQNYSEQISENQLIMLVFLVFTILNLICKYFYI